MLANLWKNKTLPKKLPNLCFGWNHGLIQLDDKVIHGAFVYIYHLYPGGSYCVKPLWAFPDKTIYFQLQWGEVCSTLERLTELIQDKTIVGFPPENSQIVDISRFVFKAIELDSRVDGNDIILEVEDIRKQLASEPDSLDLCRSAVQKFCKNPIDENLINLRELYFTIPQLFLIRDVHF